MFIFGFLRKIKNHWKKMLKKNLEPLVICSSGVGNSGELRESSTGDLNSIQLEILLLDIVVLVGTTLFFLSRNFSTIGEVIIIIIILAVTSILTEITVTKEYSPHNIMGVIHSREESRIN